MAAELRVGDRVRHRVVLDSDRGFMYGRVLRVIPHPHGTGAVRAEVEWEKPPYGWGPITTDPASNLVVLMPTDPDLLIEWLLAWSNPSNSGPPLGARLGANYALHPLFRVA